MKRIPIVVWALLAFLALRVFLDLRSLVPAHSMAAAGPLGSRNYGIYIAIVPLVLFRIGGDVVGSLLIWRRQRMGLVIAGILFVSELYGTVLRDITTGVLAVYGGEDTDDNIMRAIGHYSALLIPILFLIACTMTRRAREFFDGRAEGLVS
ncbi:MAG TPA: hypothetical protein VGQ27_00390 [Steroidobacteraceae bacterium]|jgi:hypothetical protein|nr:hypothetical protein [Steroidobacteraceae bacterium]